LTSVVEKKQKAKNKKAFFSIFVVPSIVSHQNIEQQQLPKSGKIQSSRQFKKK
jgi:hypothetical protein